jgi:hypothetical protein
MPIRSVHAFAYAPYRHFLPKYSIPAEMITAAHEKGDISLLRTFPCLHVTAEVHWFRYSGH